MRVLWMMAKSLRWALLITVAFFFGMSMVYVDTADRKFELYVELMLGALATAFLVGYFERRFRLRAKELSARVPYC
jgi:hypothetical protein